jgi:hypothetical protein
MRSRLTPAGGSSAPAWVAGPLAALWAAAIGFGLAAIPMLIVWMATPSSGLTWLESLRVAGVLWVVAHGTPVAIAGVTYSLLPWGLVVIPLLLLGYAGGWAARRADATEPRQAAILVSSGAVVYAVVVGATAMVVSTSSSAVSVVHAVGYALALAVLGLGWGALRAARMDAGAASVPGWLGLVLRAGLVGALTILGVGAVAGAASLLVHVDDAITMSQSLHAGLWGGLGLLALGIAYAPVLAVWGAAYVTGAGVVIAPAVTVSPFIAVTAPTQLPPFPLLAALPQTATPMSWLLPLAGVVAGVLAGLMIGRRAKVEPRLVRLAMAAGAAAVSGVIMAIAAHLASGSLGDLRLAHVGPAPLTVGVLAAVLVALGAVPSAIVPSPPERPRLSVADADAADETAVPDPDAADESAVPTFGSPQDDVATGDADGTP